MTGPHGFMNIGPTTSRRSTIDQLVDVITHLVKENQDLKENNATLIKQSIVAPGSEEHEFTWPEFPEEFDENGNRHPPRANQPPTKNTMAARRAVKKRNPYQRGWIHEFLQPVAPDQCVCLGCDQPRFHASLVGHCEQHDHQIRNVKRKRKGERCIQCQQPTYRAKLCRLCTTKAMAPWNPQKGIYP